MPLKPIKKSSKKSLVLVKEDTFDRVKRQGREQRAAAEKKEKDKQLEAVQEEQRLEKIVMPYLEKLDKQLDEKDSRVFWTFPDRSGFKKIKKTSFKQMQNILHQDVQKYAGRKICLIEVSFHYNKPITSLYRKDGILLYVMISTFHMDDTATMNGKNDPNGCAFNWRIHDFCTTKLTFKLLETIMYPVADYKYQSGGFSGLPIQLTIKLLKQKKIDISDVLVPLAGC